jgi:hypothetical protein
VREDEPVYINTHSQLRSYLPLIFPPDATCATGVTGQTDGPYSHTHSCSPTLTLTYTHTHPPQNTDANNMYALSYTLAHSHPHVLTHGPLTPDSNASGVGATSHRNHQAAGSPVKQGRRSSVPAWPSNETPLASRTPENQRPTDRINSYKPRIPHSHLLL